MSHATHDRLTEAAFFAWAEQQDIRHELVDGQPQAMVGATRRHDRIVANIIAALHGRLRGGRCVVNTADTAIRIPNGNIRYPDVSVDCGRFLDEDRAADAPVLVVEVLSRSTSAFDQSRKLEEYKSVPALLHVLIVDPNRPRVIAHRRGATGWEAEFAEETTGAVRLDALDLSLGLAEVYEGLEFRPVPRLVPTPQADGLG
ncbi:MAG: Uma2 family endonuclease [Acetobacteraceae bacterium]|nr:Uma2 family endonuclease [Acetobacteraceae bacterium]